MYIRARVCVYILKRENKKRELLDNRYIKNEKRNTEIKRKPNKYGESRANYGNSDLFNPILLSNGRTSTLD